MSQPKLISDTVSDKVWRLGAKHHKINYDLFSLGDPPKKCGSQERKEKSFIYQILDV